MLNWIVMGVFGLMLAAAAPAHASKSKKQDLSVGDAVPFEQQRLKLEAQLDDGATFAEIAPEDLDKVRAALRRMQQHLEPAVPVSSLDDKAKVAVFNDQELINTILTRARADSRMVCRRDVGAGSRLKRNDCITVAEERRRREGSQDGWNSLQRNLILDQSGNIR